jgi:uncharacterized protein (DUF1697 family)
MPAIVCLLRGVNVGGHNIIKMDALRSLCASLKLQNPQTLLQSGNVVFQSTEANLQKLSRRIEDAVEKTHSFRPTVILRTASELRQVIAANPFAGRPGLDPGKLHVSFLAAKPTAESAKKALDLPCAPDELHIGARELYMYFPNGMGRPTLSIPKVERILGTQGTARNWNTVNKLMEMAESLG